MKNPKLTAFLSLLFPGLGQFYLQRWIDGIVFFVATAFLWFVAFVPKTSQVFNFNSPRSYIFWAGLIFVYAYSIIDAYKKAKQKS